MKQARTIQSFWRDIVVGILLMPAVASAGQPAAKVPPKPPGQDFLWQSSDYKDCGQSCLQEKAAENLSLQGLYVAEKLTLLKEQIGTTDSAFDATLNGYCTLNSVKDQLPNRVSPATSSTDHTPPSNPAWQSACLDRYKSHFYLPILSKIKMLESQSADAVSQYRVGDAAASGGAPIDPNAPPSTGTAAPDSRDDNPVAKVAMAPEVISFSEIDQVQTLRDLASSQFQNDLDSTAAFRPSQEEFAQLESVPRNPSRKDDNTQLKRLKRKADGTLVIDTAAYQAAQNQYGAKIHNLDITIKTELKEMYKTYYEHTNNQKLTEINNSDYGVGGANPTGLAAKLNKAAFLAAQKIMVDAANTALKANGRKTTPAKTVRNGGGYFAPGGAAGVISRLPTGSNTDFTTGGVASGGSTGNSGVSGTRSGIPSGVNRTAAGNLLGSGPSGAGDTTKKVGVNYNPNVSSGPVPANSPDDQRRVNEALPADGDQTEISVIWQPEQIGQALQELSGKTDPTAAPDKPGKGAYNYK